MIRMYFDVNEALRKAREIYGELELDDYYGEQCTIEQAGEILYRDICLWTTYRNVWESSKRILDIKEDSYGRNRNSKRV